MTTGFTSSVAGTYTVSVKVTDDHGLSSTDSATVTVGSGGNGTISINNGAITTSSLIVTLNSLGVPGVSGVTAMWLGNSPTSSKYYAYQTSFPSWDLSKFGGDASQGQKWVYVEYDNANGDALGTASDSIWYDTTGPTADLSDPANGGLIAQTTLNSRGYIDVTFSDGGHRTERPRPSLIQGRSSR